MAKIIYGITSFWLSIVALLLTLAELTILFVLPPATYLFERIYYLSFTPLVISIIGLLFYYLQWRIFTIRFVNIALIINTIVLLINLYLISQIKVII